MLKLLFILYIDSGCDWLISNYVQIMYLSMILSFCVFLVVLYLLFPSHTILSGLEKMFHRLSSSIKISTDIFFHSNFLWESGMENKHNFLTFVFADISSIFSPFFFFLVTHNFHQSRPLLVILVEGMTTFSSPAIL